MLIFLRRRYWPLIPIAVVFALAVFQEWSSKNTPQPPLNAAAPQIPALAASQPPIPSAEAQGNYVPPQGYVPDAPAAIAIARAVLIPIIGQHAVQAEEPFSARREGDTWTVNGNYGCKVGEVCLKEDALVKLAAADGQILFLILPPKGR